MNPRDLLLIVPLYTSEESMKMNVFYNVYKGISKSLLLYYKYIRSKLIKCSITE